MPTKKLPEYGLPDPALKLQRFALARLRVPTGVRLVGDHALLGQFAAALRDTFIEPPSDLVFRFARLGSPSEILKFAQQFGMLIGSPRGLSHRTAREALESWTMAIGAARGLLNIDESVKSPRIAEGRHFAAFERWRYFLRGVKYQAGLISDNDRAVRPPGYTDAEIRKWQRGWLLGAISEWVATAGVEPYAYLGPKRVQIGFRTRGALFDTEISLIGVIGTQLMFVAAGAQGVTTCAACGNLFFAKRKRAASRRAFCERCGRDEAVKMAKNDWRKAQRAAK